MTSATSNVLRNAVRLKYVHPYNFLLAVYEHCLKAGAFDSVVISLDCINKMACLY